MSWIWLLPPAIGLIWACWPMGVYHQWSIMWGVIFVIVLLFEAWSAWFTPDKKTISNVARQYRQKDTKSLVRFWIAMTFWMAFGWALFVHLAT